MPLRHLSLFVWIVALAAPAVGQVFPPTSTEALEALDVLLDVDCGKHAESIQINYSQEFDRGEILVTPRGDVLKSVLTNLDSDDTLIVKVLAAAQLLPLLDLKPVTISDYRDLGNEGEGANDRLVAPPRCGVREFAFNISKVGPQTIQISASLGPESSLEPLGAFDIRVWPAAPVFREPAESFSWNDVMKFAGIFIALATAIMLLVSLRARWLRSERERREAIEALERLRLQAEQDRSGGVALSSSAKDESSAQAPAIPEVPNDLVTACIAETCVLFTGAGLAVQAGYPTMGEILGRLLPRASEPGNLDLQGALRDGRYAEVCELLRARLKNNDAIIEGVKESFPRDPPPLPAAYDSLRQIPFVGAIASSWDSLVERTFKSREPVVVSPSGAERASASLLEDAFVVAKPYGSLHEPDTFLFTPSEAQRALRTNPLFSRLLATLAGRNSLFFVGASLETMEEFFSNISFQADQDRPHFALVPRTADWSLQEALFLSRFGVLLLGYLPSPGHPEVAAFLADLAQEVEAVRPSMPTSPIRSATLSEVKLENIGPFKSLTLQLNPQWNILLGNNGSGKSTILRAIALGLCGDDEEAARSAGKLLRVGESSGSIQLVVGNTVYQTHLVRVSENGLPRVRVESEQFTALQKGSWVVLGFPPLRGVSTRDPEGPKSTGVSVPVVHDLLPLIRGAADHRLNDLKQWVVNVDAGSRSSDSAVATRNQQLRDSFFELLRKMTPGVQVHFGEVQADTWQVLVKTDDGLVPIDQVSQGMSSIFGWVGTMLQRMYEIHAAKPHPELEPALVLVDEVEAHLHPEWQQKIIGIIRDCFPNLQIVATSHSPLLVAGMKAAEVFIASRDFDDPAELSVIPAPIEFEGLRADQILTSPLFGLLTTRSDQTRQDVRAYSELKSKQLRDPASLTSEEEQRLETLKDKLLLLRAEESPAEQLMAAAVSKILEQMADPEEKARHVPGGELSLEMKYELRRRLETIMPSASEEKNDPHQQTGT